MKKSNESAIRQKLSKISHDRTSQERYEYCKGIEDYLYKGKSPQFTGKNQILWRHQKSLFDKLFT